MAKKVRHVVPFRRKRKGRTNYKTRLKLLLSNKPRIVIRKSLKNINIQISKYNATGDKIVLSVSSKSLEKEFGWKLSRGNIPAAYLTGLLLGVRAQKAGIKEGVLDIGLSSSIKGSRLYSALKGIVDSGLNVAHSKDVLPADDIISGKNIVKYAEKLQKEDSSKYSKLFSCYIKNKINISDIPKIVDETKNKIKG